MKLARPDALKLYYFNRFANVGDSLNKVLCEELLGTEVSRQEIPDADIVAIGSLLDHFIVAASDSRAAKALSEEPIQVWGTGLMYEGLGPHQKAVRRFHIHALRGELTRRDMSAFLRKNISCPLADAGLLASLLVPRQKKKYDIGLIPHYHDRGEECFQKMKLHYPNSVIIDVADDPIAVIKTIGQCKTILSTGLHGLIIADSFGIPNHWCVCSDRVPGKGYKFRDYYSSFGLDAAAYDLNSGDFPTLQKIKDEYRVPYRFVRRKQYQLLKSFPYKGISAFKILRWYLKSICIGLFRKI